MPLNEGYNPNEEVVVLRQHLQEIMAALSWSHAHFRALDMSEGARRGTLDNPPSRATVLIAQAYNRLEGYLDSNGTERLISQD